MQSLQLLNTLGGDWQEYLDRSREDAGLAEMLGQEMPSPEATWKFLHQFHHERRIEAAGEELTVGQVSRVLIVSDLLRGLRQVKQDLVQAMGPRCADQKLATIDRDATVIEGWKRAAKSVYQGGNGVSTDVGSMGGDGFGNRGSIPGRQCRSTEGVNWGDETGIRGPPGGSGGVLFPVRLLLSSAVADEVGANAETASGHPQP